MNKKLTPERLAEIREYFNCGFDWSDGDVNELLSHIAALDKEIVELQEEVICEHQAAVDMFGKWDDLKEEKLDYLMNFLNTPLSVFGGKTALQVLEGPHPASVDYVAACIRRMGYANPLEQQCERLRTEIAELEKEAFNREETERAENVHLRAQNEELKEYKWKYEELCK